MFSAVSSPVCSLLLQPHMMILLFLMSHVTSPVMSAAGGHHLNLSTPSFLSHHPQTSRTSLCATPGVVFIGLIPG